MYITGVKFAPNQVTKHGDPGVIIFNNPMKETRRIQESRSIDVRLGVRISGNR